MRQLYPNDFSKTDFAKNCEVLGEAIGCPVDKIPGCIYEIHAGEAGKLVVPSVPGKKASAAFLWYLQEKYGEGKMNFVVQHQMIPGLVDAFFAPFAGDPPEKHPTIQFLQRAPVVIHCVAQERGLKEEIEILWEQKETVKPEIFRNDVLRYGTAVLQLLQQGLIRVATPSDDKTLAAIPEGWIVHEWIRRGILLVMQCAPVEPEFIGKKVVAYDKLGSAFADSSVQELAAASRRIVRGFEQRAGAYCAKSVIGMPGFVNVGAFVDEGTMVDTWATVGSCAQIGKGVHLSGGVGIGGVLEPPGVRPVIVGDGAFIGSRCIVVEGVFVGPEAVLGAGVTLTASTHIIDVSGAAPREWKGFVPARSVVIPGVRPKKFPAGEYLVPCALIIGQRKESTDKKTSLNDALRDFGVSV